MRQGNNRTCLSWPRTRSDTHVFQVILVDVAMYTSPRELAGVHTSTDPEPGHVYRVAGR
jgi:hypothetical protein